MYTVKDIAVFFYFLSPLNPTDFFASVLEDNGSSGIGSDEQSC